MTKKTLLVLGLLLIGTSSLAPEIFYPWKDTFVGSLDGPGWPGLVIAPAKDCAFAFLLRVERVGEAAEGGDFYYLVSQVGPHSPDGLYARVKFDLGLPFKMGKDTPILLKPPPRKLTLTVEWSRRDEKTVIGRILCPEGVRVTIVHYFPWDLKGEYALLADGQVQGRCGAPGNPSYLIWTSRPGEPASAPAGGLALSYLPDADRTIAFVAGVGGDAQAVGNRIYRYKNAETIGAFIDEEAGVYEEKRVKLKGPYAGVPEAITNSLHWTVLYQAGSHRLYTPSSRAGILPRPEGGRDHWTILGENSLFNALGLVLESQDRKSVV
jgi:hypothetical protein